MWTFLAQAVGSAIVLIVCGLVFERTMKAEIHRIVDEDIRKVVREEIRAAFRRQGSVPQQP